MNRQAALNWLTDKLQPSVRPTIETDEMERLVDAAAASDADGNAPHTDDWTETYPLMGLIRSAADGWAMKAAKASASYTFASDGQQFQRAQMHSMCVGMERHFRRQLLSTATARNPA